MTSKKLNYSALYLWYERGVLKKTHLLLKLVFKLSDERGLGAEDTITGHISQV